MKKEVRCTTAGEVPWSRAARGGAWEHDLSEKNDFKTIL